jgi:uncharacterized protein
MSTPDQLPSADDKKPWYRHRWGLFVFGAPMVAAIASLGMVYISLHHADQMVDDNYYRDGLAINRDLAQIEKGKALGAMAAIRFNDEHVYVMLHTTDKTIFDDMQIAMLHPVEKDLDVHVALHSVGNERYEGDLPAPLQKQKWYLRVSSASGGWQVKGQIDMAQTMRIHLMPQLADIPPPPNAPASVEAPAPAETPMPAETPVPAEK